MKQEFAPGLLSTQITKAGYYFPASRPRRADLDIVCAGWEECRSDYLIKRSGFPWKAIELVVRGTGWVEAKGRRLRLRPGSLVSYGPGIAYRMTTDSTDPMLKYFVDFTGTQSREMMSAGRLAAGRIFQAPHPQELQIIVDQIIIEGNRKSELSREIANNYLRILLQKLHEARGETSRPGGSRALESYLKAKVLLDKDYQRLASAEAAAEKLGLSPETLCRLFHRFSSTSPYQYLLQLKVNRAVDLLMSTPLLIKEVGERSGFQDAFQFSRIFKRLRGTSPHLFRRAHKRT